MFWKGISQFVCRVLRNKTTATVSCTEDFGIVRMNTSEEARTLSKVMPMEHVATAARTARETHSDDVLFLNILFFSESQQVTNESDRFWCFERLQHATDSHRTHRKVTEMRRSSLSDFDQTRILSHPNKGSPHPFDHLQFLWSQKIELWSWLRYPKAATFFRELPTNNLCLDNWERESTRCDCRWHTLAPVILLANRNDARGTIVLSSWYKIRSWVCVRAHVQGRSSTKS